MIKNILDHTNTIALGWLIGLIVLLWPDRVHTDHQPIYLALAAIIGGASPYNHELSSLLAESWKPSLIGESPTVIAYPLPALLPLLPSAFLPYELSLLAFVALGSALVYFAFRRPEQAFPLAVLLYYPLIHVIKILNPSFLWLGVTSLLALKADRLKAPVLTFLLNIAVLKPQAGLIFAAVVFFRSARSTPGFYRWFSTWAVVLWGGSLLIDPNWIPHWAGALVEYAHFVPSFWAWQFIPACLLCLRLPWQIGAAFAQAVLFPINCIYAVLPLLIGWQVFRPHIALIGSLLSLLPGILGIDLDMKTYLLLFLCGPYLVACAAAQVGRYRRCSRLRSFVWSESN